MKVLPDGHSANIVCKEPNIGIFTIYSIQKTITHAEALLKVSGDAFAGIIGRNKSKAGERGHFKRLPNDLATGVASS